MEEMYKVNKSKDPNAKVWVIADTHFGHTNVIKYSNRPFSNVDEMNKEMIKRWNSVVRTHDLVYVLGDFSFKLSKEQLKALLKHLKGRKFLICGNHDMRSTQFYLDCGFIQAIKLPILYKYNVILKHIPPKIDQMITCMNYIFGHIHNNPDPTDKLSNCKCVSVERTDYYPLDLEQVISEFK